MINWDKYFDHIFVLSACKNFERRKVLEKEFDRIGLTNFIYMYQPESKLLDYSRANKLSDTYVGVDGYNRVRCKYVHYNCIKTAYELGYDHICILEDDNIFLKDIDVIQHELDVFLKKRENINIYLFDYVNFFNTYFFANFYYLNRFGMEYMIYMLETYKNNMNDHFFFSNDLLKLNNGIIYTIYGIIIVPVEFVNNLNFGLSSTWLSTQSDKTEFNNHIINKNLYNF